MKNNRFIVCLIILCFSPVKAAVRYGLGSAVAKRSADLIHQAGATTGPVVGDNVAPTLPSCPAGAIYDSVPTDLSQVLAIDPLGHVAPSPHTFPTDHIYFYRPVGSSTPVPVYAPGNIHVTRISSSEVLSASPVFTDYAIYFYACKDVKSYFAHVRTLSPSLISQAGAIDQNCFTYTTGGTFTSCEKNTNFAVSSGDLLGYSSTSGAFDFGTYDYRNTPLAFISPSRRMGDTPYTVCPIDYFNSGLKASMEALLGRFDGGFPRVTQPVCGQIMYDIAGTAKGDWYFPGAPGEPEDPHLALIDNNVSAPQQTISIGDSLPNQAQSIFTFNPNSAGFVNRDFAQVNDNAIYCYDTFFDPIGQPSSDLTILIQLLTPTTLRIEVQAPVSCGAGPWSFTSNAVTFQR